jgi:hypothetical protein
MKIGELFFQLGFQTDTVKVNDFINMIGKLNFNSVLASLGVGELYENMKNIMTIADQTATGMNLFGKETGLSAQKMTQWSRYAEQMGVSGDTVTSALTTLQKKAAGLKSGLDSSLLTPLYMLNQAGAGITNADIDNPFTFLDKALKGLQMINPELRTTVAGMLGISEKLLALKSFKDADLIIVPTPEQVTVLMNYHKIWTAINQNVGTFFLDMASTWAPDLQAFGNSLNNMVKYAINNIAQFKAWAEVLVGFASLFIPFLRIPYVLEIISTHFRKVRDDAKAAWEWMVKVADAINPNKVAQNLNKALGITHPIIDIPKLLSSVSIPSSILGLGARVGSEVQKFVTQHNTITINGNNPHEIAKAVDERLNKHLSDAQYQSPLTSR